MEHLQARPLMHPFNDVAATSTPTKLCHGCW